MQVVNQDKGLRIGLLPNNEETLLAPKRTLRILIFIMERNSTLKFGNKLGCSLRVITLFDIFLLNVNFDKFSIELHFLHGDKKKKKKTFY